MERFRDKISVSFFSTGRVFLYSCRLSVMLYDAKRKSFSSLIIAPSEEIRLREGKVHILTRRCWFFRVSFRFMLSFRNSRNAFYVAVAQVVPSKLNDDFKFPKSCSLLIPRNLNATPTVVYLPHSFPDQSLGANDSCLLNFRCRAKEERSETKSGKMWRSRVNNPKWFLFHGEEWGGKKSENKV